MVERQATDSAQDFILRNQRPKRDFSSTKRRKTAYFNKTSHRISPAVQFTLWVVKVRFQANVYFENRILLLLFMPQGKLSCLNYRFCFFFIPLQKIDVVLQLSQTLESFFSATEEIRKKNYIQTAVRSAPKAYFPYDRSRSPDRWTYCQRSSAIIWKHFSTIGRSSAIIWNTFLRSG